MSYEVVNREHLCRGKVIDVYRDTITLPNGETCQRETVYRGNAAAIVAVDEQGRILLVEQYRHALGAMTLEIPAGMIEEGEDAASAAYRELEEETGFRAGEMIYFGQYYMSVGFSTEQLAFFLAKNLTKGTMHTDPDEFITVKPMPVKDAMDLLYAGKINDGKTMAGLLAYQAYLQNGRSVTKKP